MRVTAPICDDTLQNPTWRAFPAALRVVGNLLDAGAVHPRRSARGHLLALAVSNGIAPDPTALPESRLRVQMVAEAGSVAGRDKGHHYRRRLRVRKS